MLNIDLKTERIKENVFTASPSKRCCVLETFLLNIVGFKRKELQKWISSLSDLELKNKVIRLEGAVLEDFMTEYIDSHQMANIDSLYMLTSDGVRSLFGYYLKINKAKLGKSERNKIEELSQRFTSVFCGIRNSRINHLVFWEQEIMDAINIPDMSKNINISNSPGVIVTTGNHNEHLNTHNNKISKGSEGKPQWLKLVSWVFIIGCLLWAGISFYLTYSETNTIGSIDFGWQEMVQIGGVLLGILLRVY